MRESLKNVALSVIRKAISLTSALLPYPNSKSKPIVLYSLKVPALSNLTRLDPHAPYAFKDAVVVRQPLRREKRYPKDKSLLRTAYTLNLY